MHQSSSASATAQPLAAEISLSSGKNVTGFPKLSGRLSHIDALRGTLMMWGVFVHAGTLGLSWFFDGMARVSGWFRMEAFFMISGFFSYMLVLKYGQVETLKRRLITILVPFLVILLTLNPLTSYLIYLFHNGWVSLGEFLFNPVPDEAAGPIVWHLHLWFLLVLAIYALLTPILFKLTQQYTLSESLFNGGVMRSTLTFAITAVIMCAGCLAGRVFFEFFVESWVTGSVKFIARSSTFYLPFFWLGMFLYRSPEMLAWFHRPQWIHLPFAVISLVGSKVFFDQLPKKLAETFVLGGEVYLGLTLANLLFGLFLVLVSCESPVSRFLSDSAYSVYLLHFFVLYSCAIPLASVFGEGSLLMGVVTMLTLVITLLIHGFVINKSPLFKFLLNGKLSAPRKATK